MRGRGGERRWLDDWRASEVVVEDGFAVGLENGLGRHAVFTSARYVSRALNSSTEYLKVCSVLDWEMRLAFALMAWT